MLKKTQGFIISILMFLSVFSLGFASWTIAHELEPIDISGSFQVDDVKRDNYVTIEITEGPKSNQDGFFTSDDNQRNKIKMNVTIDIVSFMELFANQDVKSVQVSFTLAYAANVTASTTVFNYLTTSVTQDGKEVIHSFTKENYQPILTINLSGEALSSNPTFEIVFAFENVDASYFTSSISPFTQSGSIFTVTSRLSILEEEVA